MAGSGSAWIKPKKRAGLRPAAMAGRAHPTFVRAGQRYFPLQHRGATTETIKILRAAAGERWEGVRDDRRTVRVSESRLLAVDEDGQGRFYRFVGYASRRYDTHGVVVETGPAWSRIVLPEWHPALTVPLATGVLAPAWREVGAWIRCRADLGARQPAHTQVDRVVSPEPGFDPGRYPPIEVADAEPSSPAAVPALGPGCGDVVLFVSDGEAELLASDDRAGEAYVTGHPPPVDPGGRIYVHARGRVLGWRRLGAVHLRPNGTKLVLDGPWRSSVVPASCEQPSSGVAAGEHGRQRWVWRGWPREAE